MPVCDICNKDMRWEDGYVLTTRQVATTESYWEAALKGAWSATHAMDPEGGTLPMLVQQQAAQSSGWLICESCSTPFSFDKHQAKAHARAQNGNPPGAGSAPAEAVARAAATVWKRLYGSWPASIQFAGTSPQEQSASEETDNNPQSVTEGGTQRNLRRSIAIVASCLVLLAVGFWKGPAALEELANRLAKRSQAPSLTSALYGAACQLERFSACGALARRYESGVGVSRDPDYALVLLRKACLKGSSSDCIALIKKRNEQVGIDVDTTLASALAEVQKKCDSGEVGQCETLGFLYLSGVTGASDPARAAKIYAELCKLPEAKGCGALAFLLYNGLGVTEDKVLAVELYDRACKHDDFDACISFGIKHRDGEGVEKDESRALTLFETACNGGVGKGCALVATYYITNSGVDSAKARTMLTRACELDFAEGCLLLGGLYLGGWGGPKDNMRGVAFLEKACELGDPTACKRLGTSYANGESEIEVAVDKARALQLWERACEVRDAEVCAAIGSMYETGDSGLGIEVNIARSLHFLQRACSLGYSPACAHVMNIEKSSAGTATR